MTNTNTSATGGPLVPQGAPALADDDLDAFLQALVTGVTGMNGTLVRPRWQPDPPPQPEASVDWCSIGVTEEEPEFSSSVIHHGTGDGYTEIRRQVVLTVLASFYGPNCKGNAGILRDAFWISQNREPLFLNRMAFVDTGNVTSVPDLVNRQWVRRADIPIRIRQQIVRIYPVENLLSADITIQSDEGTPINSFSVSQD